MATRAARRRAGRPPPPSRPPRRPDVVARARSSTRSTSAASPTANGDGTGDLAGVRAAAALPARPRASTPSGSRPGTSRRWRTAATTSPTTAPSTRRSARSRRRRRSSPRRSPLGIRTIVDIVPNHVSDRHPWFQAALAAGPGSPERARFWFRPGRGADGAELPTAWPSQFWGPHLDAHDRTRTARPASGTSTCSRRSSRTSTGTTRTSAREHEDILRFWFDRGAAGVRIDSAALLLKDPTLPEVPDDPGPGEHPTEDRDELHDIYRSWRAIADGYPGTRILVGEVWLPGRRAVRALPPPRRAPHRVQLRLHGPALGRRRACARRSMPRSRPMRPSARRRPGSSPTTT